METYQVAMRRDDAGLMRIAWDLRCLGIVSSQMKEWDCSAYVRSDMDDVRQRFVLHMQEAVRKRLDLGPDVRVTDLVVRDSGLVAFLSVPDAPASTSLPSAA